MSEPQAPALLRTLQTEFAAAMRTPLVIGDNDHKVQADAYSDTIVDEMIPNSRLDGLRRLSIYNQQYWFRLLNILQEEFPLLRARLGLRSFNAMATVYLDRYPSQHPELHHLGTRLAGFLREDDHAWSHRVELVEAAELDAIHSRIFLDAEHEAFDGRALSPEDLQQLAENPFPFQRAWSLYREQWNSIAQRQMVVRDKDMQGPIPTEHGEANWAIYRDVRGQVCSQFLSEPQYRLLVLLHDAALPLAQATEQLAAQLDEQELAAVAQHIGSWFTDWAQKGWFSA